MPLNGTGNILGGLLAAAVGAPSAAGSFFNTVGSVIASWAPSNIQVIPGAMAASGGAVAGLGSFTVTGSKEDLGGRLCNALAIPPTAPAARAKWIALASALIIHFNTAGKANGTGLSSGSPCTGAGTLEWSSPTFNPPLAAQLGVSEPVAALALEAFALALLNHLKTNAAVVALSLSGPPLSAPPTGAVVGTGTIA